MIIKNSIRISNIYYMLAYAFRSLNIGDIIQADEEEFNNLHELFAEIIINGMRKQFKRGLPHRYTCKSDELSSLRGKIDIQSSIRRQTIIRHRMVCEYDEFTENTSGNQLIKYAITHLLKQSDVSAKRKQILNFYRTSLGNVNDVINIKIPRQNTGGAEYIMLLNICRFLLEGMLMKTGNSYKMNKWLTDEAMSSLYEHFLLEYFKRHYQCFNARSAEISWDVSEASKNLPKMKSDVYLTYGNRVLIIDAKFYNKTMSNHYEKKKYHSHNLYQIFTYVKNADKDKNSSVSGMLLYAKTDESETPDDDLFISGNRISLKTLDLTREFNAIKLKLDNIANYLLNEKIHI